jgi:hypothetical protein
MPKATKHSTRKAKRAAKRVSKNQPRGLALISAGNLRKRATAPDLKGELRLLRHSADVEPLVVFYDAYKAAADAILGIQNQPRAQGTEVLLDAEWNQMVLKAWTVAECLKGLRPTEYDRENYVRVLVNAAFEMGANAEDAASVFKAAMAVGTQDEPDFTTLARKGHDHD